MKGILVAALVGLALGLGLGWKISTWRQDSMQLAVEQAAEAIRKDAISRESNFAKQVQDLVQETAPVERVIDRGIIREVQKTEYRNVCFSPDLVRLLNEGAKDRPADPSAGVAAGGVPTGSAGHAKR